MEIAEVDEVKKAAKEPFGNNFQFSFAHSQDLSQLLPLRGAEGEMN